MTSRVPASVSRLPEANQEESRMGAPGRLSQVWRLLRRRSTCNRLRRRRGEERDEGSPDSPRIIRRCERDGSGSGQLAAIESSGSRPRSSVPRAIGLSPSLRDPLSNDIGITKNLRVADCRSAASARRRRSNQRLASSGERRKRDNSRSNCDRSPSRPIMSVESRRGQRGMLRRAG